MLPEKVSRSRRYILSQFFPLLHRKYLCLLRPQWEEHCAVVFWEAMGCREQEHGPASLAGGGLLGVFSREL